MQRDLHGAGFGAVHPGNSLDLAQNPLRVFHQHGVHRGARLKQPDPSYIRSHALKQHPVVAYNPGVVRPSAHFYLTGKTLEVPDGLFHVTLLGSRHRGPFGLSCLTCFCSRQRLRGFVYASTGLFLNRRVPSHERLGSSTGFDGFLSTRIGNIRWW